MNHLIACILTSIAVGMPGKSAYTESTGQAEALWEWHYQGHEPDLTKELDDADCSKTSILDSTGMCGRIIYGSSPRMDVMQGRTAGKNQFFSGFSALKAGESRLLPPIRHLIQQFGLSAKEFARSNRESPWRVGCPDNFCVTIFDSPATGRWRVPSMTSPLHLAEGGQIYGFNKRSSDEIV